MKFIKNLKKKYKDMPVMAKATAWFFVCNVLQKGISLITIPIFTRLMSTEEYGVFSTYTSWLNIFTIFTTFKLNYGVFNKGMTIFKEKKEEYTSTMLYITTILCTVFCVVYFIFRQQINAFTELSSLIMVVISIEMIFTPAVSFWSLRERYDFKYKSVFFVTICMSIMNAVFGLLFVFISKDKAVGRIVSCAVIDVLFGVFIYFHLMKKSKCAFNKTIAEFAIKFNLPLIPHYLAEYVLDQSDRVFIQKVCSRVELGLYSVVYNAGMVLRILISSLNSALIPWLYQSMEKKLYNEIRRHIMSILIFLSVPLTVFIAIAPEILRVLAAPQYYSAVAVIPPVTASIYFVFLFGIYGNIEFFWDKNKFTMYVSMGSAVLNIVLNWIAIPIFGYVAAAYTTLICYFILTLSHALFVEHTSKRMKGSALLDERKIWIWSVLFCTLSVVMSFFYPFIIIRYLIVFILTAILYYKRRFIKNILKGL